jgi:hypothetical protein
MESSRQMDWRILAERQIRRGVFELSAAPGDEQARKHLIERREEIFAAKSGFSLFAFGR